MEHLAVKPVAELLRTARERRRASFKEVLNDAVLFAFVRIAAVAHRYRATVHTADTDFDRFPGVRWRNPLLD